MRVVTAFQMIFLSCTFTCVSCDRSTNISDANSTTKEEAKPTTVEKAKPVESNTATDVNSATLSYTEKIDVLEKKVRDGRGKFDWKTHNELRDLYGRVRDEKSSLKQCDIIFKNSFMDGYTLDCCGARNPDKNAGAAELIRKAEKFPEFKYLFAACLIKAAELQSPDDESRAENLRRVVELEGDALERYRELARNSLN